jgi:hypothetical protein
MGAVGRDLLWAAPIVHHQHLPLQLRESRQVLSEQRNKRSKASGAETLQSSGAIWSNVGAVDPCPKV